MGAESTEISFTVMPVFPHLRKNCSLAELDQSLCNGFSNKCKIKENLEIFGSFTISRNCEVIFFFPQEVLVCAEKLTENEIYFSGEEE